MSLHKVRIASSGCRSFRIENWPRFERVPPPFERNPTSSTSEEKLASTSRDSYFRSCFKTLDTVRRLPLGLFGNNAAMFLSLSYDLSWEGERIHRGTVSERRSRSAMSRQVQSVHRATGPQPVRGAPGPPPQRPVNRNDFVKRERLYGAANNTRRKLIH